MGEETWPLQRNRTEHFVHWKNERWLSKSRSVGVSDDELVFGEMMAIRFSQGAGGVPPRNPGVGEATDLSRAPKGEASASQCSSWALAADCSAASHSVPPLSAQAEERGVQIPLEAPEPFLKVYLFMEP